MEAFQWSLGDGLGWMVGGARNSNHEVLQRGQCSGGIYFLYGGDLESNESLVEEIVKSVNEIFNMIIFGNEWSSTTIENNSISKR